jgi:Ca2+:H+ antiporter
VNRTERALLGLVVLAVVLAGVSRYAGGFSDVVAFIFAALALAGVAWIVSFATEQVGQRLGVSYAAILQATIGNLPEFFVVIFALNAGQRTVAETAILGSILVNALLVLGLVIVVGARHSSDGVMRFSTRLPNDTATLLLVAAFIIVLIGLANSTHDPASHHTRTISIVGAVAILLVYLTWLRQYLRSAETPEPEETRSARLSLRTALATLVVVGVASAFVSEWFIHSLTPTIKTLDISKAFAGLVIVAIAGNAVEHAVGVVLAARGRYELAISVVKTSVSQIAAFLYPVLVLASLLTPTTLTFALAPVYIGALFGTAVIVWQITGDGEATVFEGVALVAAFVILATVASFEA